MLYIFRICLVDVRNEIINERNRIGRSHKQCRKITKKNMQVGGKIGIITNNIQCLQKDVRKSFIKLI